MGLQIPSVRGRDTLKRRKSQSAESKLWRANGLRPIPSWPDAIPLQVPSSLPLLVCSPPKSGLLMHFLHEPQEREPQDLSLRIVAGHSRRRLVPVAANWQLCCGEPLAPPLPCLGSALASCRKRCAATLETDANGSKRPVWSSLHPCRPMPTSAIGYFDAASQPTTANAPACYHPWPDARHSLSHIKSWVVFQQHWHHIPLLGTSDPPT